jgi:hypothetical protein
MESQGMGYEEVELRSIQDRLVVMPVDGRDAVRLCGAGVKPEAQPTTRGYGRGDALERSGGGLSRKQEV